MKKLIFAISIILLASMICSCRGSREFVSVTDTIVEQVHDTTEVYLHDTTLVTDIRYDSVDRFVERITYVDTNGVVHEREVERLTKVIRETSEEYRAKESYYRQRIEELQRQLLEIQGETIVEVAKPVPWPIKALAWIGGVGLLAFIIWIVFKVWQR
ncbi:MAG: hypothetical protein SPJ13_00910 [Bacteroidales bacterium]|nr:hypothetical protein [Bacteroidales bacterium]